jgi:hypothetical protein
MTGVLRLVKTLLFMIAGSCIYIGLDNMKKAFQCKKDPLTEKERLHGWRILIIISISFFIAGFLLILFGHYLVTRFAGTG